MPQSAAPKPPPGYALDSAAPTPPAGYTMDSGASGDDAPKEDWRDKIIHETDPEPNPDNKFSTGVHNAAKGVASGVLNMTLHPWDTAKGMVKQTKAMGDIAVGRPDVDDIQMIGDTGKALRDNPAHTLGSMAGQAVLTAGIDKGLGAAAEGVPEMARGGATGADSQALRALNIAPKSTKAIRTLGAVEGARPYLKGMDSVESAQTRIPAAKSEIWSPYQEAIDKIGDNEAGGSTVRALEEERQQLSALNRGIKTGDPAALQLAQQKGMTQAQLLEREEAVKAALDPELQRAGIKPQEIRKAFGQVSQVGSRLLGRSTVGEADTPYGFGRMANIQLAKPRTWLDQPLQGARDLLAGRPAWSGKASDVAVKEAFRSGGDKPDFGRVSASLGSVPTLADHAAATPFEGSRMPTHGGVPFRSPAPELMPFDTGSRLGAMRDAAMMDAHAGLEPLQPRPVEHPMFRQGSRLGDYRQSLHGNATPFEGSKMPPLSALPYIEPEMYPEGSRMAAARLAAHKAKPSVFAQ
jgi:hypothetical protein